MGTGSPARPGRAKPGSARLTVLDVAATFREISKARGPAAKSALTQDLLSQATPLEAKYIVKIMTGDLRIGLKESLVEEAIAKAYGGTLRDVQRANMLLGDIGETLQLAATGKLAEARMRLFHPLGFMLASPAESAEQALSYFQNALVEDKYDGIRAQAHCSGGEVRIFSRTRDEITESFPELPRSAGRVAARRNSRRRNRSLELRRQRQRSAGVPPASGGRPAHRAESKTDVLHPAGSPLQYPPAALGTKATQRKLIQQVPVLIWSSMCSMRVASCCWSALCSSARSILDALLAAPRNPRSHSTKRPRERQKLQVLNSAMTSARQPLK